MEPLFIPEKSEWASHNNTMRKTNFITFLAANYIDFVGNNDNCHKQILSAAASSSKLMLMLNSMSWLKTLSPAHFVMFPANSI